MKRVFVYDVEAEKEMFSNHVTLEQRRALENDIMNGGGVIVQGTGGLKKIRCGAGGRGKSGGVRVLFADYPQQGLLLVVAAFGKKERENLTHAERNGLGLVKQALDRKIRGEDADESKGI